MGNVKSVMNIKKIILDTNFLIDLFRFRLGLDEIIDIVGAPCVFLMVQQSVGELKKINDKYAKLGLSFIDSSKIKIVSAPGRTADDAILSFLKNNKKEKTLKNIFVATNDAKLRKKVRAIGGKAIYLRAMKQLKIIN